MLRLFSVMALVGVIVLSSGLAGAAELSVSQKNKRFAPKHLQARLGDTLVFVNDDRYAHNLYSESSGFEFDVRKQMPGDVHKVKLDKRGTFQIRCVIHPRMKMTVDVE